MKTTFVINKSECTVRSLNTEVVDLTALGHQTIERASNVEFDDHKQAWFATYPESPGVWASGPCVLPGHPPEGFAKRSQALAWEREWANREVSALHLA